ncbi:surfactin synthase thioesterase subunit [Phytomonospora endophytica]|uniref:Surfactin synthase thioesterase subunit n=1 Tax=Phytomonospora endophytica TaxID=714109 RepID=A0A841FYU7_9ACTN|nr:surfactin synthase thioesterase subunit [Phytomonospora endophytica]GIG69164.1 thioesterase [Phytomonospora endophytica]
MGSVAPLAGELSQEFAVSALRLPGREDRFAEPPMGDLGEAVDLVAAELEPMLDGRLTVMFGHSFGALLAYLTLLRLGQPDSVQILAVAGRQAPHLPVEGMRLQDLPDSALLAALDEAGGLPTGIGRGETADLLSPIRADLALDEQHTHDARLPAVRPLLFALSGSRDPWAAPGAVGAWCERAADGFTHLRCDAGHFFPSSHATVIRRRLAALRDGVED